VTNFDTISGNVGIDFNAYDIFDKKSDLTFEKGSLYAYHHVGNVNAQTYVNDLSGNIIFDNFKRYFDKDYIKQDFVNEIYFNGNYFAKALDTPLDNVSTFDNFSVNFDIKIEDNTKPIGSQIVGNYSDRGFGIYNYRRITPHTVSFKGRFIYIFNSFGELLKELDRIYQKELGDNGSHVASPAAEMLQYTNKKVKDINAFLKSRVLGFSKLP